GYLRRHQRSITVCHLRTIHEVVSKFANDFLEKHADAVTLTSEERLAMENSWREVDDRLHFSEGRILLLGKSWSEARQHLRAASSSKSAKVRAAAFTGWLLSLLHRDMEPLMRLGGRSDLRVAAGE